MSIGITQGMPKAGLPISWSFEDHVYFERFMELIDAVNHGATPNQKELEAFFKLREQIWSDIDELKKAKGDRYFSYLGERFGIATGEDKKLVYSWKNKDYDRVDRESQYYTASTNNRLIPAEPGFDRPCIIVFASGRAFSKMDARSRHLNDKQIMKRIRFIMAAQTRMVQEYLAPRAEADGVQIVVFAYDLVDEDIERKAMRAQYGLDPDFILPVAKQMAERVFGPRIAEAEFTSEGIFVRENGKIKGKPRSDDEILRNLSHLVLTGICIGDILGIQAIYYLKELLHALGVSDEVTKQAIGRLFFISLLPSSQLIPPPDLNYLAVSNRFDEVSIVTVDLEGLYAKAKAANSCLLPQNNSAKTAHLIFDTQSTIYKNTRSGEFEFDYKDSFFGHNAKFLLDELQKRGFDKIVRRILKTQDAINLGQMIEEAIQNDELVLEL